MYRCRIRPGCPAAPVDRPTQDRVATRTEPALYIIEDAHWIDAVSESMIAGLLTVIQRTPLMVMVTAHLQYDGALMRVPGAER